jgi:hypothetical protein
MLRRPILLGALLATAVAVPALAQTGGGGQLQYSQTCTTANASQEDKDSAAKLFEVAKKSLNESDFDRAISLFKQSYDFYCAPEILLWLADAFERKGDRPEAVRALLEYKRRAGDTLTQDKRDQIDRRIRNLGGNPNGSSSASATAPATTSATAPTTTGTVAATVTPTGTGTATAPTASTNGTTAPTDTGAPSGGHTIAPWIVVGVGGAAVITGAILLPIGIGKVNDANNACPTRMGCAPNIASQGNSGRSLEGAGYVVGGIGLAAVIGGLLWHFLEPTGPSTTATTGVAPVPVPVVGPGYAGVSAGGAF